jgi:hypothetical protein
MTVEEKIKQYENTLAHAKKGSIYWLEALKGREYYRGVKDSRLNLIIEK